MGSQKHADTVWRLKDIAHDLERLTNAPAAFPERRNTIRKLRDEQEALEAPAWD